MTLVRYQWPWICTHLLGIIDLLSSFGRGLISCFDPWPWHEVCLIPGINVQIYHCISVNGPLYHLAFLSHSLESLALQMTSTDLLFLSLNSFLRL